jgi:hypothetical protein
MTRAVFFFAVLLGGCQLLGPSSSSDAVRLVASYNSDSTQVHLTLINESDARVGYNLCGTPLVREESGQKYYNPALVCTQELRGLEPGERAEGATPFERASLPSGTYRAAAYVWQDDERRDVRSQPFEIE